MASTPGEDFARAAVPEHSGSSGLHLALIVVGGTIGFSVFIVSAQIGGALGFQKAGLAFVLGSLVLGLMGAATSYIGARSRLSTYLLTQYAFGPSGAKIANLTIALSLIGWYGVISNFVGMASQSILRDSFGIDVPAYWMVLLASTLMILVTLRGFQGIDRLALWLVPVMAGFVVFAAYKSTLYSGVAGPMGAGAFSVKTAISAVIGTYIAGVIIQPDYSRFAGNTRHATWAIFIALGVIYPAILFLSAVPSIMVGDTDLLRVLGVLGLALPAFLLLLLGAWSSNVLCLYSSGLSIATVSTRLSLTHIILAIGIVGTAIALLPAQAYLVSFLVALGVIIPPIGAIYVLDAWLLRRFDFDEAQLVGARRYQWPALLAWAGGCSFGFAAHFGYGTLSGVASFDALILTSCLFAVFNLRRFKQSA